VTQLKHLFVCDIYEIIKITFNQKCNKSNKAFAEASAHGMNKKAIFIKVDTCLRILEEWKKSQLVGERVSRKDG